MDSSSFRVLSSESWSSYKWKRGDLISGGNQFCSCTELFGPLFCISILKVSRTKILLHSLDFNASVWFRSTFLRRFKFPKIIEGDQIYWGGTNPAERLNCLVAPPHLYFNFRSFKGPNYSSFIRFHCILHHSRLIFAEPWNIYKLKRGNLISWGEPVLQNDWIIWTPFCISILKV